MAYGSKMSALTFDCSCLHIVSIITGAFYLYMVNLPGHIIMNKNMFNN